MRNVKTNKRFIDKFGAVSDSEALTLRLTGYSGVCIYLCARTHPEWQKGSSPETIQTLRRQGHLIVSNFEGDPTHPAYFTVDQARQDAADALEEAQWLGQPPGTPIYFSVDFNAQPSDYAAIRAYFAEIVKTLGDKYAVGVYGSYDVITYLYKARIGVSYYWQTLAWSGGKVAKFAHIYQGDVDVKVGSMMVDVDTLLRDDVGAWPTLQAVKPSPPPKVAPVVPPAPPVWTVEVSHEFNDEKAAMDAIAALATLGVKASLHEGALK